MERVVPWPMAKTLTQPMLFPLSLSLHMSAGTLASHLHEDGDPAGTRATATARALADIKADQVQQQYLLDRFSDYREEISDKCRWRDELRAALETGSLHANPRIAAQTRMLYEHALIDVTEVIDRKLAEIKALCALIKKVARTPHHTCTSARDTVQALGGVPCAQQHAHDPTTITSSPTRAWLAGFDWRNGLAAAPPAEVVRAQQHACTHPSAIVQTLASAHAHESERVRCERESRNVPAKKAARSHQCAYVQDEGTLQVLAMWAHRHQNTLQRNTHHKHQPPQLPLRARQLASRRHHAHMLVPVPPCRQPHRQRRCCAPCSWPHAHMLAASACATVQVFFFENESLLNFWTKAEGRLFTVQRPVESVQVVSWPAKS